MKPFWIILSSVVTSTALVGCALLQNEPVSFTQAVGTDAVEHYDRVVSQISYPDVETLSDDDSVSIPPAPISLTEKTPVEYWDLTLDEAVQLALTKSQVLRELGGVILQAPGRVRTVHTPAIQETDPRFGIEGALSAFDAQFTTNASFEKNDRALNNVFFGGGTRLFQQDLYDIRTEFSKTAATGSVFSLRQNTIFDKNNAPGNQFPSAWNVDFEAEIRQPLFQGAGVEFNRIAGPDAIPGVTNGVVVARINVDVSQADFELGLRNFVSNVENAYWDLYFAYRDLEAKKSARDAGLKLWKRIHPQFLVKRRGGEAEKEAQAREQFFNFQEQVQNALSGRLLDGTRTNNGSSGGTFRGLGGVQVSERRLRLLINVPINDGRRLIRPADEPAKSKILFDWELVLSEALSRRIEIKRQKLLVKRREVELIASRNFVKPQLDAIARYRWRGFGDDLLDPNRGNPRFDNAFMDLTSGDFQEWQVGLELSIPIGFRRAHAGVRHAQLLLARERALLHELERQVIHDLSNAIAEMDRAYIVSQTAFNRRHAARDQLAAVEAAYDADKATSEQVLDAQRRLADAESRYYLALSEYALSIKNIHFEKGSLMEHNGVVIADGNRSCCSESEGTFFPEVDSLSPKNWFKTDEADENISTPLPPQPEPEPKQSTG